MPTSPESPPIVPGSPDIILPSLQALLGLPELQDIPLGEDFGLTDLFWLLVTPTLKITPIPLRPLQIPRASSVEACAIYGRLLYCIGREELLEGSRVDNSYPLASSWGTYRDARL
jgi:hypothetical protein